MNYRMLLLICALFITAATAQTQGLNESFYQLAHNLPASYWDLGTLFKNVIYTKLNN